MSNTLQPPADIQKPGTVADMEPVHYTRIMYGAALAAFEGRHHDIETLCGPGSYVDQELLMCGGVGCVADMIEHTAARTGASIDAVAATICDDALSGDAGKAVKALTKAAVALINDNDDEIGNWLDSIRTNSKRWQAIAGLLSGLIVADAEAREMDPHEWLRSHCLAAGAVT